MPCKTLTAIGERIQMRSPHDEYGSLILATEHDTEEIAVYVRIEESPKWHYAYLAGEITLRAQSFAPLPGDGRLQVSLGTNLFLTPQRYPETKCAQLFTEGKEGAEFRLHVECPAGWEIEVLAPAA